MEDSIKDKIDFKFLVLVTLLGTWWTIVKYYGMSGQGAPSDSMRLCLVITSFFIFCPLVHVGLMLIYMSLYQVAEEEKVKERLISKYNKSSRIFFNWWALAIILAPTWIIITIFPDPLKIYSIIPIGLYGFIMLKYYFNGIYTYKDIDKYYKSCLWWMVPYFIVFAIAQYLAKK